MFGCLNYPSGLVVTTSRSELKAVFRWMLTVMTRVGIDPKYKGGSIRIAAASAAIDRGVPIDVVLNTGRWASWQVFNRFYNRARLRDVAPSIGLTSLA